MDLVQIAIVLGLLAVVYGFVTSRQVLGASAGSEKMQEIAAAIQEGAQAYLKRQYTTIAIVGAVVAVLVAYFLGMVSATGFLIANLALVLFGLWCWAAPLRRATRAARPIAWAWAGVEMANGLCHCALAVLAGGYFPGLATAPLLIAAAAWLGWRLGRASRLRAG